MKINSMDKLFEHELEDLLSAEQQLVEALPLMAEAANNSALKTAFKNHLKETKTHVTRLERAFKILGKEPKAITCKGMQGLIKEGEEIMKDVTDPAVMDAGLIAAAQRVEHYEIAGYGTAVALARLLGKSDHAEALQATLDEEHQANEKLTQIAMGHVNLQAAAGVESVQPLPLTSKSRTGNAPVVDAAGDSDLRVQPTTSSRSTTMPRDDYDDERRERSSGRGGSQARYDNDDDDRRTSRGNGRSSADSYDDDRRGSRSGGGRSGQDRERDGYGQYASSGSRDRSSSARYEEEDDSRGRGGRSSGRSSGKDRERDEYGQFTSREGGGRFSRSNDDDDDRRSGSSGSRRSSGRSNSSDDDDDRGRRSDSGSSRGGRRYAHSGR